MNLNEFNKYDSIQIDMPREEIGKEIFEALSVKGFFDCHVVDYAATHVSTFLHFNRGIEYVQDIKWRETYLMRPCRIVLVEKTIKNFENVL